MITRLSIGLDGFSATLKLKTPAESQILNLRFARHPTTKSPQRLSKYETVTHSVLRGSTVSAEACAT